MARPRSEGVVKGIRRQRLADMLRAAVERLAQGPMRRFSRGWNVSAPLVAVPNPLRAGNAWRGQTLLGGKFTVAGKIIEMEAVEALSAPSASPDWAHYIQGFYWLRDLAAIEGAEAENAARFLTDAWARVPKHARHWTMALASARLLALLADAPLLLGSADRSFYSRFRQVIGEHVALLRNGLSLGLVANGREEIQALAAVIEAHLVIDPLPAALDKLGKWLERVLDEQLYTDGGHVSRNPEVVFELLVALIPLRDLYITREVPPPSGLLLSIERILPMLRFFSHPDGSLALMNGMGPTDRGTLANIFAADDVAGRPALEAQGSGYQRLEAPGSALIVDCGFPPPPRESAEAHAGTLAFEFTGQNERLIVNCGVPAYQRVPWRHFTRRTAAHSTLTIDDTPSTKIVAFAGKELLGQGPTHIPIVRTRDAEIVMLSASHDGYARKFGLIHQRTLWLSLDGRRLDGEDRLEALSAWAGRSTHPFAIRFHLHPDIRPSLAETGDTALLATPSGAYWAFRVPGGTVEIEESAFLGEVGRSPRTTQLVIRGLSRRDIAVSWFLVLLRSADER